MIGAVIRLDWREARRQAEELQSMGAGARGPMSASEQEALRSKLERLIAEANERVPAQGQTQ